MSYLDVWVVFDHPRDFPNWFVARKQRATANGLLRSPEVILGKSLEEVRYKLPVGLVRIIRDPSDDPVIVESWF